MFFKKAFDKVGSLVTGGDDEQKKPEEQKKKDSNRESDQIYKDLMSGKDFHQSNRDTRRTAVPVKRDFIVDQRYDDKPVTGQKLPQKQELISRDKGRPPPDFFSDLISQRDEELKDDEEPMFLKIGDKSQKQIPNRATEYQRDNFFDIDRNERKQGTIVPETQRRNEDMRQGIQNLKDSFIVVPSSQMNTSNYDPVQQSPSKFITQSVTPLYVDPTLFTLQPVSKFSETSANILKQPQQQNQTQQQPDSTLPNNIQSVSGSIPPQQPSQDQSKSIVENTSYSEQRVVQQRSVEGISPALLRIQERKRGTILASKQRPEIDDLSIEITQNTRRTSKRTDSDQLPINAQKKETSSSFVSDTPITQTPNQQLQDLTKAPANQQSPEIDNFVDYSTQRVDTLRIDTQRRAAINKKASTGLSAQTRLQQQMQEEIDRNSSESYLTDKSFEDDCSVNSDDIDKFLQQKEEESLNSDHKQQQIDSFDQLKLQQQTSSEINTQSKTDDQKEDDFFKLVSDNEMIFKNYGEKKAAILKNLSMQTANSLSKYKQSAALQKVVTDPILLRNVVFPQNVSETCIAVSDEYIILGTTSGLLYVYNKDQALVGTHKEDGRDFIDNAITSIDVHPLRPKYVVIGFKRGQMSLIDITKLKDNLKLIKDIHKKPIVSVKFCDWLKERPHLAMGTDHKCNDCTDPKDWMFMSIDTDGKVVLNTVVNIKFGLLYANDYTINDPIKIPSNPVFQAMSPRFHVQRYPQEGKNDVVTLVALASYEGVVIKCISDKSQVDVMIIDRPKRYPSENMNDVIPITSQLPCLAWGFGKTPRYNFQPFPLLAIAWGPLIQLVVYKDIEGERERNEDFQLDGCYIIAQGNFTNSQNGNMMDNFIESLHFIDESLLYCVTATQEIRIMNTEKFKEDIFLEPEHLQVVDMTTIDSRCKMQHVGTPLSTKQIDIEMERISMLEFPLLKSQFGQHSSQTQAVIQDRVVCLTEGGPYTLHHLGWLESLGNLEQTVSRPWIEIFAKALEIYLGKVKGLRIVGVDEDMRKGNMRDQLKILIEKQVTSIINQWQLKVEKVLKSGSQTSDQFEQEMQNNFSTLIRIVIEFCIEISEPAFLFDVLLKKFVAEGRSNQFAEEIKPYIICREFSDCIISENVLDKFILEPHRNSFQLQYEKARQFEQTSMYPNPAENFEKILINLRLDNCSQELILNLIVFCRSQKLSSGLIYTCQNGFELQGPLHALVQLRDMFLDTFTEEATSDTQFIKDDLLELRTMSQTDVQRIPLESSSIYIGIKLLWTARLYLIGKKFPVGHLTNLEWHIAVHDIVNFLIQDEIISQLTEIDAAAYFQILSIVFNNPSAQFTFIEQGRPEQTAKYQPAKFGIFRGGFDQENDDEEFDEENIEKLIMMEQPPTLTHDKIVQRVIEYFKGQQKTDDARLHYLCFIASISGTYEQNTLTEQDVDLYFEVALELLKHSDDLVSFNKDLIQRRMTNKQMYRRLSNAGNHVPDDIKHVVLSEEMLLMLIERCKPYLSESRRLDQLIKAAERTSFENVKLVLYETNQDYLQCLKLFMRNQTDKSKPKLSALARNGITDGFGWMEDKHKKLEEKVKDLKDKTSQVQLQNFENEVLGQAMFLVKFNTVKTIQLCDAIFKSAHLEVLEKLQSDQAIQLVYITKLVELKKEEIKEQVSSFGGSSLIKKPIKRTQGSETAKWTTLLSMHVKLLCMLEPLKVTPEIEKIIKDNFYPMEECLKICIEQKQIEGSALLYKKIGNYQEAVNIYLQILGKELSIPRFKKEVFYLDKDQKRQTEKERAQLFAENQARLKQRLGNQKEIMHLVQNAIRINVRINNNKDKQAEHYRVWVEKFGKNIGLLDRILEKIQSICRFHPEVLVNNDDSWKLILLTLFKILFDPSLRKKGYCKRHLKLKMVGFCRCILPYVSFGRIVAASVQNTKTLRFKAIKELVHDVFQDKSQEFDMCLNAQTTQQRDLVYLFQQDKFMKSEGVSFQLGSLTCGLCQRAVNFQTIKSQPLDEIKVFNCYQSSYENHAFHARCIKQTITQEIANDKSKKGPTTESEILKLLRCPICHPKNLDHTCGEQPPAKPQKLKDRENGRSGNDNDDSQSDSDSSKSSTKSSQSEIKTKLKRTARPQLSQAEQRQVQREKHMKLFEDSYMNEERLSLDDFTSLK